MIQNLVTGKVYVGRAVNLRKRWTQHKHHLRAGTHHSPKLQRSWSKHGEAAFKFVPLAVHIDEEAALVELEQHYMDRYKPAYNCSPSSKTNRGVKYSAEARARMSIAQKGRVITETARAKIAESLRGRRMPQEVRDRIGRGNKGKKVSSLTRAKLRDARLKNGTARLYHAFGREQTLGQWAHEFGLNHSTLKNRVRRAGENLEQALSRPALAYTEGKK